MLAKKNRRNLSLNTGSENSAPAKVYRGGVQERSVGAVTIDSKRTGEMGIPRLNSKKESLKVIARHADKDMMEALLSNEPPRKSYNILNKKLSQIQDKSGFGWKTERTSKEFSIKKNSLDWIHLKERLNTQKVADNEETQNLTEKRGLDYRQKVADFLATVAKIGNDANYWLGEDSKLSL
jgi:hypothetical protein